MNRIIFVFGANAKGIHGAGSAGFAACHKGAIQGQGSGLQGESYALTTCHNPCHSSADWMTLSEVEQEVDEFIAFAKSHPELTFDVTQVGCGHAGHTKEEIAPLFLAAPENCRFDLQWKPFLGSDREFWGTF